jgi:hypothetical protein
MHDLMITDEERTRLIGLLEHVLEETRVEIHRTHTPDYRNRVVGERSLLQGLLEKLQNMQV